ncbi:MAG: DUF3122 domain-containing protein [Oscillatoria sp. PMC 1051.18]|nr:DUF3122 domain-containing protein [Oscillatoria sp. PMC 1050.18]MEC5029930.1 DUF3122 domain-containing protein [Oscillatoria sp. PMC 1051.18]
MRLILSLLLSLMLLLGWSWASSEPAWAAIRQQEEAPGQMLYQSRHTLRDDRGQAWQLVLFKRVKNGTVAEVSLRLVGFPGVAEFAHPQNLTLRTSDGKSFLGGDRFAEASPAANVGEYDLQEILPQLAQTQSIKLILPLKPTSHQINIPFPVLLEWQEIAKSSTN